MMIMLLIRCVAVRHIVLFRFVTSLTLDNVHCRNLLCTFTPSQSAISLALCGGGMHARKFQPWSEPVHVLVRSWERSTFWPFFLRNAPRYIARDRAPPPSTPLGGRAAARTWNGSQASISINKLLNKLPLILQVHN